MARWPATSLSYFGVFGKFGCCIQCHRGTMKFFRVKQAPLAQSVEHLHGKEKAVSSNLTGSSQASGLNLAVRLKLRSGVAQW